MQAQIVTMNTQTLGTGYLGNNGQTGITFLIENTNPYPAILTDVSNYMGGATTTGFNLYYSSTSLSGSPGAAVSPTWTLAATSAGVVVPGASQVSCFPTLSFTIPALTTYRFLLMATTTTLGYTTAGVGVTPDTFVNNGIKLKVGSATVNSLFVGYGWYSGGDFSPRAFTGSVTLNLLSSPCSGVPTGGTANASPVNPCPSNVTTLSLTGSTNSANLSFQWIRSATNASPWTVIAGATTPSYAEVPPAGTSYYRCIVSCTNPGGGSDTSVATAPVTVQTWSPTSNCYCVSSANFINYEEITNVTMGTLNNTTDCVNPLTGTQGVGTGVAKQFANFTGSVPAPIVYIGLSQSFWVNVNNC